MNMTQRRMARPSLGGLLATRRGALMLAVLCAVAAAAILVFALGRYRTGLRTVTKQATVLVATGNIPKGTSGNAIAARGLYKPLPIVSTQLAAGAISDASLLQGKILSTTVLPGQQLTLADFTAVTGLTGVLAPNQRAISVAVDEAHGDTDVLQSGDRVDIYAQLANGQKATTMILLVPDALVIKPGSSVPASVGGVSISGASLVLAVTAQQAPQVAFASANGSLYLSLRPANATPTPPSATTLNSILAGR